MRRWEKASQRLFVIGIAILPAVLVRGWGNSFTEPKLACLLVLSVVGVTSLALQVWREGRLTVSPLSAGLGALLVLQIASPANWPDVGVHLQAIALTVCALSISLYVGNTDLRILSFVRAMLLPSVALLVGALAMILFRIRLFSTANPFGAAIGLKNSLSVFLAQCVPLMLIALHDLEERRGPLSRTLQGGVFVLLSSACWVVFSSRTRSAWWMLMFYLLALFLIWARTRERGLGRPLLHASLAAIAGIALLTAVPDALVWTSSTPYSDSVSTLFSFTHSSGRDQLWRVGLHMVASHPWLGIGAGRYPALWRSYIAATGVDARVFAFLRPDLPIFNDYLQFAIENGVASMLILLLVAVGVPAACLVTLLKSRRTDVLPEVLLCLLCLATALDALVDYPFLRPETLLTFTVALGLAVKGMGTPFLSFLPRNRGAALAALGSLAIFAAAVCVQLTVGFAARTVWRHTQDVRALEVAWSLWPWDSQWNHTHVLAFLEAGENESAERFARERLEIWPHDPESYLIEAKLRESYRQFDEAVAAYRRATITVESGRCYQAGYEGYLQMTGRSDVPASVARLTAAELARCVPPPASESTGGSRCGQQNAVWVQSRFFLGHQATTKKPLQDVHIVELAAHLRRAGMKYAFVFAGPFNKDGTLPEYAFSDTARRTVERLRELAPEVTVLPWVGGVQDKTVFLDNPQWVDTAVRETKRLVETLGVRGAHFDFEYVSPALEEVALLEEIPQARSPEAEYGAHLVQFHKRVRDALPAAFISTVVPSTVAAVHSYKMRQTYDEVRELARYTDQIALLYYDTALHDQEAYEGNLVAQLRDIEGWRRDLGTSRRDFLIGLGTFVNVKPLRKYRDLAIENLPNEIATLKRATQRTGQDCLVDGVAIFCEWQTNEQEWNEFHDLWAASRADVASPASPR
jgi:O-antigen ligase